MHIIFKSNLANVEEKYTVLDLDTFAFPDGTQHTACCVIDNIPITELPYTEQLKKIHEALIENYALRDWNFCEQAIAELTGKWGGIMDSFYSELQTRITLLKTQDLDQSWTPIITRE
jgi:hypothetical protein